MSSPANRVLEYAQKGAVLEGTIRLAEEKHDTRAYWARRQDKTDPSISHDEGALFVANRAAIVLPWHVVAWHVAHGSARKS